MKIAIVTDTCVCVDGFQLRGDVRLTPFYNALEVVEKIEGYVKDINENITDLPTRGSF